MLVSEAIKAGYREANIIVIGESPSDDENAEALSRLNDFRDALFGSELGENLEDWAVPPPSAQSAIPENLVSPNLGSTWYLCPRTNSRLLVRALVATTIKFPENPNDGSRIAFVDIGSNSVDLTLNGNGRLIEGQPLLVDTPQAFAGKQWFYRADLASWEAVEDLTLADNLPLPREYNDLFICYVAIRMSPRHSQEVSEKTVAVFDKLLKQAKARYRQTQAIAVADPRISESEQTFTTATRDWFD